MTPEELTSVEEIKKLKGRYCRLLDTKDWDGYANLFTRAATLNVDTGVTTMGGDPCPLPEVRGRADIRSSMSSVLHSASTVHQCHTPEIELTSAITATGIWAMEDVVEMAGFHLHGRGHYHERYAVEGGEWRIAALHLTRTRIEMLEGDPAGPA